MQRKDTYPPSGSNVVPAAIPFSVAKTRVPGGTCTFPDDMLLGPPPPTLVNGCSRLLLGYLRHISQEAPRSPDVIHQGE